MSGIGVHEEDRAAGENLGFIYLRAVVRVKYAKQTPVEMGVKNVESKSLNLGNAHSQAAAVSIRLMQFQKCQRL